MKKLIALVAFAAGVLFPDSPEIAVGAEFEIEDVLADQLVLDGSAKLAEVEPAKKDKEKKVKVRLLVDCEYGKANAVVTLDAGLIKTAGEQGIADASKAAVAYAESLQNPAATSA